MLPDLCSIFVWKVCCKSSFSQVRIGVCTRSTMSIHACTRESSWNPTGSTLGPDQLPNDSSSAFIITKHYFLVTVISCFYSHKEKLTRFKTYYLNSSTFLKIVYHEIAYGGECACTCEINVVKFKLSIKESLMNEKGVLLIQCAYFTTNFLVPCVEERVVL